MAIEAPLSLHRGRIRPDWIDYNGHMNLAYYVLVFDFATDALLDYLGMDEAYRRRTGFTTYVLETHVTYERELKEGDAYHVTTQLLDWDAKRLHYFQCLYRDGAAGTPSGAEGVHPLAATTELILMHMDTATVRGAPMPETVLERVRALMAAHEALPRPPQVGRVIGIRSRRR